MPKDKTDVQKLTESCTVTPNRNIGYLFIKRTLDIFASIIGLIVLLPLFLIVSVAIFIDDPGPVLFLQERIGKNGKSFRMFKFRSIVKNAEDILALLSKEDQAYFSENFKLTDDPRVNRKPRVPFVT